MLGKIQKMMKKNNKGFTLVELMAVVLIIGILVAIAVPMYNASAGSAKWKTHAANIRTVQGAIEQAKSNGVDASTIDGAANLTAYIKTWPTKPGIYSVTDGVLTANPTEADTIAAIAAGTTTWTDPVVVAQQ